MATATEKGFLTGILYTAETSYGSAMTVATAIQGKVKNFGSTWANNYLREQGLGEGRNQTFTGFGPFDCGGSIEGIVGRFDFFAHLIGAISGAGSSGSPYVLNEGNEVGYSGNDIASFTMQAGSETGDTDRADTYTGCLLNNVTFSARESDFVRFNGDWVGQKVATNIALVAYSADTTALWQFAQGVVKWGATPSTLARVTNFNVTMANQFFIYRALNSRFIQQPETGLRRYDWTLTIKAHPDLVTTLIQDFFGQAGTPHEAKTAASPTSSLEVQLYLTGPTNQNAYIQLDESAIDSIGKTIDLGAGIVEMTFTGHSQKGKSNQPIQWQTSA